MASFLKVDVIILDLKKG